MTDRETWLSTIRSNPSDWQAMLVFADWLLAAEQWRWIACVAGAEGDISQHDAKRFCGKWPNIPALPHIWREEKFAKANNIRSTKYPRTIEDVQAYLERV